MLIANSGYRDRAERMTAELRVALDAADRRQLLEWAADTGRMTGHVFVRRIARLGRFIAAIGRGAVDETTKVVHAGRQERLGEHVTERCHALIDTVKDTYA